MEGYAERLKALIEERKLSPENAAKQTDEFSLGYLYKMLRGEAPNPSYRVVRALSGILGVSVVWLMEGGESGVAPNQIREIAPRWGAKPPDVVDQVLEHVFHLDIYEPVDTLRLWASLSGRDQQRIADIIALFSDGGQQATRPKAKYG